jgi:hypothetical protein
MLDSMMASREGEVMAGTKLDNLLEDYVSEAHH